MAAPAAAESPPRDPLDKARKIAAEIARDAGKILMQGLGTRPAVGFKSEDINLVTEYDKRSEALIVERLAAAFPADRIVAEEGTNVLGVVEAPAVGWSFAGTITGGGSTLNGKPIAPSRVDRLASALLVTGFPYA